MRISIVPGDPGHEVYAAAKAAGQKNSIWLDGVQQREVITADEEQGWLKRYRTDETGKLIYEAGEVQTETLRGVVRIEIEG